MRPTQAHPPRRLPARLLLTLALGLVAIPSARARAQTGRIIGTVTDSTRLAVAGAQIRVEGTSNGAVSDEGGRYTIPNVTPGTYSLRVHRVGQQPQTVPNVDVRAGADTRVDVVMSHAAVSLAGVVVSASRRTEKITDAPATITRLDASQIENSVGNSFGGALKEVKGIDFIQMGITAVAINARGFNSSFNNRVLMLEDGRIAVARRERTAARALCPRCRRSISPTSRCSSARARRSMDPTRRTASSRFRRRIRASTRARRSRSPAETAASTTSRVATPASSANFGYKVFGEYQAANDFSNHNVYAPVATGPSAQPVQEVGADFNTNVARGGGSLVYYSGTTARLEGHARP